MLQRRTASAPPLAESQGLPCRHRSPQHQFTITNTTNQLDKFQSPRTGRFPTFLAPITFSLFCFFTFPKLRSYVRKKNKKLHDSDSFPFLLSVEDMCFPMLPCSNISDAMAGQASRHPLPVLGVVAVFRCYFDGRQRQVSCYKGRDRSASYASTKPNRSGLKKATFCRSWVMHCRLHFSGTTKERLIGFPLYHRPST